MTPPPSTVAEQLRLEAGLADRAGRSAAVPCHAIVALADDEVAEEGLVSGKLLSDAHHHRPIHVAFARAEVAVVREVAHRGADGYSIELV